MAMGLFQILKEAFTAVPTFDDLNDEFYDGLEEALILADVGADTACDIVEQLRKRVKEKFIGRMEDVKDALRDILRSKLDVGDSALTLRGKPAVVLVIGVNGVGKTTSIGKLAARLKGEGKKVLLCAGDTFRAAAADQLEIWAGRAGVDIVRQNEGADPGAVLFDALQAAKARNADVVLCDTAVKDALRDILRSKLDVGDSALTLRGKPAVVLVIGVNGVGKTTSIGKLAARLKGEGKKVLLCAGDTFRAAAADQLEIWAGRAGVDIVRQNEGADPGAVLFDALQAAKARNADVVLCDTAGRLHNKQNLMNELAKLRKIIDRECPDSACETLLVLDATTGQNGLIQARTFKETAGLTGIVLTKLDGTAKGGIVIAIAQELGVPVKFVGVGEGIDDLKPFDPAEFVRGMV